ncbi:hypothetical protein GCM10011396_33690 [Undibacterium terreum]|uniref:Tetratricopeptide repeat-containing protein n=2 Tax=Undibacterium terreum TaxID=1224302 RepID=A0A916URL3_9BURK|nr:hypothetical protein GCM10011396_33690 [Undibacterium terreum]
MGYQKMLFDLENLGTLKRLETIANYLRPRLGARAQGIVASFSLSVNSLGRNAIDVLELLCAFAPNVPIPLGLVKALFPNDARNDNLDAALAELADRSLVKIDSTSSSGSNNCVEIHPLLAEFVLRSIAKPVQDLRDRIAVEIFSKIRLARDPKQHKNIYYYASQARPLVASVSKVLGIQLGLFLGMYEHARGQYKVAEAYEEKALRTAQEMYGPYENTVIVAMNNLADTKRALGDYQKAMELQRIVLESALLELDGDPETVIIARLKLAASLRREESLDEALEHAKIAFDLSHSIYGANAGISLDARNDLALILADRGDVLIACEMLKEVIDGFKKITNENEKIMSPVSLDSAIKNLSFLQSQIGILSTNHELHLIKESNDKYLPTNHPDNITVQTSIASFLRKDQKFEEARKLLEETLELAQATVGTEVEEYWMIKNNLANVHMNLGNSEIERELDTEVYQWRFKSRGKYHSDTLTSAFGLAQSYLKSKDIEAVVRVLTETGLLSLLGPEKYENNAKKKRLKENIEEMRNRLVEFGVNL